MSDDTRAQAGPDGDGFFRLSETDKTFELRWRSGSLKYQDFKLLSEGGIAKLYSAFDENLRRTVVYKTLHDHLREDEIETQRFLREARVTANIAHPGTVPLYELGRDRNGNLFFTMKHVRGRDLRNIIDALHDGDPATTTAFPLPALIDILTRACETVAHAHSRGVIHRDLKPENILVDEFQDTNEVQYRLLSLLKGKDSSYTAVGDDDQSIYGWRGAKVGNILRFEKDYPSAKVIKLEENYRSTGSILEAANSVISNNKERLGKNLKTSSEQGEKIDLISVWDGIEEARKISIEIENLFSKGLRHDQMAVLVRAGHQTRLFEERFIDIGIPYKVIGAKFYERLEIRDVLAYLRVVQQPKDDLALERIINVPKRGLGSSTINLIHSYGRNNKVSFFSAIQQLLMTDELRPNVKRSLQCLVNQFIEWKNVSTKISHTDLALQVFEESGYLAYWQNDKSIDGEGRLENLKELINAMSGFENLSGFLEHISLVMDGDNEAEAGEVSLMTLHAAKGLEFDAVFLPGWEEGLFPSQRSIDELGMAGLEEERRLAYVGITRAKKRLYITFAANRQIHGLWQGSIPSRSVSYTHLRAHETPEHIEIRLQR